MKKRKTKKRESKHPDTIRVWPSDAVQEQLTKEYIDAAVQTAVKEAERSEGWSPGLAYRGEVMAQGRQYTVAVNYLPDRYVVLVGLPDEIGYQPMPLDEMLDEMATDAPSVAERRMVLHDVIDNLWPSKFARVEAVLCEIFKEQMEEGE